MSWLNYHHLHYFWSVAREGSIARASRVLRVAPPTISAQLRQLEEALGVELFDRGGRQLALTDAGRLALRYADGIFGLGREMAQALAGEVGERPLRLVVGIADVVPKLIAHHLVEPALRLPEPVQVVCLEDKPERLLTALAAHEVDLVLTDAPTGPGLRVRAYNHLLGECSVGVFGTPALARRHGREFPGSLQGAPFLLPSSGSTLRLALDAWFEEHAIRPRIVGEFDDSALLKVFGQAGEGLFCAPSVIEEDVVRHYRVRLLGRAASVRERFYAISAERRIRHRAVMAISEAARGGMFAEQEG
jgi:LysR family transcriptional activator of nhaA